MPSDHDRLKEALRGARGIEIGPDGVLDAISSVISTTTSVLDVDGAGLMMVDGDLALSAVAWTDEPGRVLETVQEQLGRGPCVESLVGDVVIAVPDLAADGRWPEVASAVGPVGVAAVAGPVHVDGQNVGALNVYASTAVAWPPETLDATGAFAAVLGQLLSLAVRADRNEGLVSQLQQALDSRITIERAVGVLMGRHDLSAVDAFNLLRGAARRERRRVADLSVELLDGRPLPS